MISKLMKDVMRACNLKQSELAEVLGASLSRVKAITSGRVLNLTREENEALASKLGIRASWLITGEGDMFGVDETKDQFAARLQATKRVRELVNAMPLKEKTRGNLAVCMTGDPAKDGPIIAHSLFAEALKERPLTTSSDLTVDEAELLACYRDSPNAVRRSIKAALREAAPVAAHAFATAFIRRKTS